MADPTPDQLQALMAEAQGVRARAYAPYSKYPVGAALLGQSGAVYLGCNVENASFGLTMCAERVALFRAVADGEREFVAIAIVTEHESDGVAPCGACRQALREFSPDLLVAVPSGGPRPDATPLGGLLPQSFGPEDLAPEHRAPGHGEDAP